MRADLTRNTFAAYKHFSAVLAQQGRVQVDADSNEQGAILLHYLRTLAADLKGPFWGDGFEISPISTGSPSSDGDFLIGAGHYYVDGIVCELESTPVPIIAPMATSVLAHNQIRVSSLLVDGLLFQSGQYIEFFDNSGSSAPQPVPVWRITDVDPIHRILTLDQNVPDPLSKPSVRRLATYQTQPDYADSKKLDNSQTYQVYLDVWERLITFIEDDSIREVALGGPDTSTRVKTVWQVKTGTLTNGTTSCLTPQQIKDRFQKEDRGRLKAMVKQSPTSIDPCILSPKAGYRGTENQLYRVEIHRSGQTWDGKEESRNDKILATFKWSRENGSVIFPIVGGGNTREIFLENLGRDGRIGLSEGDWVEVVDDDYVLQGGAVNLLQVLHLDPGSLKVTVSGTSPNDIGKNLDKHPFLRRWDHKKGNSDDGGLQLADDGAALIVEDSGSLWLSLEDGIQIQFQTPDAPAAGAGTAVSSPNNYRSGDYWLIPARFATGDVEWPKTKDNQGNPLSIAMPPEGVEHHYAPLALLKIDAVGNITTSTCSFGA